jgi:hypothetical protein
MNIYGHNKTTRINLKNPLGKLIEVIPISLFHDPSISPCYQFLMICRRAIAVIAIIVVVIIIVRRALSSAAAPLLSLPLGLIHVSCVTSQFSSSQRLQLQIGII